MEDEEQVVMIAVDNSSRAQAAFDWYMDHYSRPSHKVVVAHCMEQPVIAGGPSSADINATAYGSLINRVLEEGNEVKEKYARLLDKRGVRGEYVTSMEIRPEYWIIKRAKELKPKLLVIGSRGLGTIRRKLLGSVSEHVLHHAHCAVAICHG